MIDRIAFGKRIKEYRIAHGYSLRSFGALANTNASFIQKIESGEKLPSLETYLSLMNSLELPIDYFLIDSVKVIPLHSDPCGLEPKKAELVNTVNELLITKLKDL